VSRSFTTKSVLDGLIDLRYGREWIQDIVVCRYLGSQTVEVENLGSFVAEI
jgi:hypothetical protein